MAANPSHAPKLLDQVRGKIRLKHYSIRTEQAYVDWIKRFILHFDKRHPRELGAAEVEAFLTHLAVAGNVAAATQNGAKSIIGGGDSVKALNKSGLASQVTFASTGGGASLEFLEGIELPGVAALSDK